MKVAEKIKNIFLKMGTKGKIIGLSALVIGNVGSIVSVSVAWFSTGGSGGSNIDMVTGDVDVEIRSVSAYKQVYPYHKKSVEFVNYDADPTLKKYVIKDYTLTDTDGTTLVDNINFTSDDATITLGESVTGTYETGDYSRTGLSQSHIHCPSSPDFRYYLVGDEIFAGEEKCWTLVNNFAFANKADITDSHSVALENVVISAGASFIVADYKLLSEHNKYLNFASISSTTNSYPFRIVDNSIKCLKSGAYNITYSNGQITIVPTSVQVRKDSIISNNSLDPTKINIDYLGSADKTNFSSINDFMPTAIYNQNSMVVLDVELNYKNVHRIEAGLKVERDINNIANSISTSGGYNDKTVNLDGGSGHPLHASDFYCFYPLLTKTSVGTGVGTWTAENMWKAMHRRTDTGTELNFLHIKHGGEWCDMQLVSRNSGTEYYIEGVSLTKGDSFRPVLHYGTSQEVWRGWNEVKNSASSLITDNFGDDDTSNHYISVKQNGLYDIYVSTTPDGSGDYISIRDHSTVLHLKRGDNDWEDLALTINSTDDAYYIQDVSLEAGDLFKINIFGEYRGWSEVKSSSPQYANFAEEDGEDNNIEVVTDGTYDIYVSTTPDGSGDYITLKTASGTPETAHSKYVLNLYRDGSWSEVTLYQDGSDYYIEGLLLEADDKFNINLNDSEHLRKWSAVKQSDLDNTEEIDEFFEASNDGNIKVKVAGTYDIHIQSTPDASGDFAGQSITMNSHSVFSKFKNLTGAVNYDTSVDCKIYTKENTDSVIIEPSSTDNIYHCYIGIDYDYVYSRYFLYEKRLGKTYYLYRDYVFHFTATQLLEDVI